VGTSLVLVTTGAPGVHAPGPSSRVIEQTAPPHREPSFARVAPFGLIEENVS
jgi:hypothetical protein